MKMMKNFLCLIFFIVPLSLIAHPHTFMDMRIGILSNQDEIVGFKIEWEFDYFFSSSVISQCDWDNNGHFDTQELEHLEYFAFNNLENFHYFTTIIHNDKLFYPKKYNNFKAWCKNDTLCYSFVIPYKVPFNTLKTFSIGIYDDTFYCDVAFLPERSFYWETPPSESIKSYIAKAKKTITYDNEVVGSKRAGAIYTGVATPDILYIKNEITP